jgi:hypothetical protein
MPKYTRKTRKSKYYRQTTIYDGLYLGKFNTIKEVDDYIDGLIKWYKDDFPDVSITKVVARAKTDGVKINHVKFSTIFKKLGLPLHNSSAKKGQNRFGDKGFDLSTVVRKKKENRAVTFIVPSEIYEMIYRVKYKKELFTVALKIALGIPMEEMIVKLDDKRTVLIIRFPQKGYAAVLHTPITSAEKRIISIALNKANEGGGGSAIKAHLSMYGFDIYGGHVKPGKNKLLIDNVPTKDFVIEDEEETA